MSSLSYSKYVPLAKKACEFLTASPDPFFVVKNCVTKLEKNGYQKLDGSSSAFTGQLIAGGKYYYIVEYSTIVAFAVGPKFIPNNSFGFHIIGGHTDSPNLKLKPRSKRNASGCTLLGVQCYGKSLLAEGRKNETIHILNNKSSSEVIMTYSLHCSTSTFLILYLVLYIYIIFVFVSVLIYNMI